jgi:hypothetical protein
MFCEIWNDYCARSLTTFLSAKTSFTLRSIVPSKQPSRKHLAKQRKAPPKQQESVVAPVLTDVDDQAAVNSKTHKVRSEDIQGLKYFDMLLPLLERLHGDQCGRGESLRNGHSK